MKTGMGVWSRREFLSVAATAAAGLGAALPSGAQHPRSDAGRRRKVLHVIGHSHIDAAWLWPWRDGADTALTTMRSALHRMKETPGFCYSHSSTAHYRWVQRADPAMFAEIQARIREGRWEVVGGWPVEPDCNIPSTESFVRHCLYGKAFCREFLGTDVRIAFNPDSFGHAAGLPTVLGHAGYDAYVFMRPQEHEMDLPLLFWWEGPDGSRVLAVRIYKEYSAPATLLRDAAVHAFAPGMNDAAFFLGVGDHGGAVTIEQIRQVRAMQEEQELPEIRWSTVGEYLATVRQSPAFASLPVVRGELQHHSRGCYSAYGEGKLLNRRAERWLGQAETISLVANVGKADAVQEEYATAWGKVLFCQFHDMMAGTSLYADYQDVRDTVGGACDIAQERTVGLLERMATRVDLREVKESAIFLMNPLPWPRKTLMEYHAVRHPSGTEPITCLQAKDGTRVPLQWRPPDSMTTDSMPRVTAWVELPACGYRVFELAHGDVPPAPAFSERFAVSETGFGISSVKAEDGTELLQAPIGLVAIADTADTWAHGINEFRHEMGRPMLISSAVVETGPVMRVTRQRARWMNSEIACDITEYAGMDLVALHFVIDWHEHEQMLKLEIPTAMRSSGVAARVPGEVIRRRTNGEEEPYQDWVAVEGTVGAGKYYCGLVNDGTYSYDCLDGLLRTVLIRSAPFARHNPNPVPHNDINAWQDQGRQERRFWLIGGKAPQQLLTLDRLAEECQTRVQYVVDSAHEGSAAWEQSFLEVQPSNIWVLAFKAAEANSDRFILRLQERAGVATEVKVRSSVLKMNATVSIRPWELKTLAIHAAGHGMPEMREVSLLEI